VVLQHVGGEELTTYTIRIEQSDGPRTYTFDNDPWVMGQCYYLPINQALFNEEKQVKVSVYTILADASTKMIFDGIITPRDHPPGPVIEPVLDPMLVTTLRTSTIDEDLICYDYTIDPNINPVTFIYQWMFASTGPYTPLTRVLFRSTVRILPSEGLFRQ